MNDFAASHRLNNNMLVAANDIVNGELTYTDVGCFNCRYFSYVAAFGAFTDVAYDTPQVSKNIFGKSAYIFEGIKRLPTLSSYHVRIECDELEAEGDYIFGMASNALTVGGIKMTKKTPISMDDGYFEVMLVKKGISDFFNAQMMLHAIVQGVDHPQFITYVRTKRVKLFIDKPVSWTLDGEFGGDAQNATVTCIKKKLKIYVPPHPIVPVE
jgi:diacylglycerol kinase family enzyme